MISKTNRLDTDPLSRAKAAARLEAKSRRETIIPRDAEVELLCHFPIRRFLGVSSIGGYWPLGTEINIRPLMRALAVDHKLALPCTPPESDPLRFKEYVWGENLILGPFNTREPQSSKSEILPDLVLVPLLSFTQKGERLGYGGGYYDRTLAILRATKKIFACGVAYAAQETRSLPTSTHDAPLDGILTEDYFKAF